MKTKTTLILAAALSLGAFAELVEGPDPVGFLPPIEIVKGTNTLHNVFNAMPPRLESLLQGVVEGDHITWPGFAAECRRDGDKFAWYDVKTGQNANAIKLPKDRKVAICYIRTADKKTSIILTGAFTNPF